MTPRFFTTHNKQRGFIAVVIVALAFLALVALGWQNVSAGAGTPTPLQPDGAVGSAPIEADDNVGSGRDPALIQPAAADSLPANLTSAAPDLAAPSATPGGLRAEVGAPKSSLAAESSFTVNTTTDDVDADLGDGACAAASGACTLRAAVQEANANPDASLIILPQGTYSIAIPGSGEDASASGDLDITSRVTIQGAGNGLTIVSGGGLDRVFDIGESGSAGIPVMLTNLIVRDGTDNGTNAPGGVRIRAYAVTMQQVTVSDNIGEGIGVDGGVLTLNDCRVSDNVSIGVGGVRATSSTLIVNRSSIQNNSGVWGGVFSDTSLTLTASTVSGNRGSTGPGGLRLMGKAVINNSTISGNTGSEGGAIWADQAVITISSSTITNNTAAGSGGEWQSGSGGGIFFKDSSGSITLQNTILAGNTARSGKPDCAGNILSGGHNLIGDLNGCTFTPANGDLSGVAARLAALQDNGGATFTHALQSGSPALDAGDPAVCKSTGSASLATDQRGSPRCADGNGDGTPVCDIGAFEVEGTLLSSAVTLPAATTLPSATPAPPVVATPLAHAPQGEPGVPSALPSLTLVAVTPLAHAPQSAPGFPPLPPLLPPPGIPAPLPSLPANCREVISNGSFEGDDGWYIPATQFTAGYDVSIAHSGSRSARTGILNPLQNVYSYSSVWQQINIPANVTRATLSFWLYPTNNGPIENYTGGDLQMSMLVDYPNWGYALSPVRETLVSTRSDSRTWTKYQFELNKYAGQTLWLYFGTYNNGWAASWGSPMAMFVDDVSLVVCQP